MKKENRKKKSKKNIHIEFSKFTPLIMADTPLAERYNKIGYYYN